MDNLDNGAGIRPCAAMVEYKDRSGHCQREAKYLDQDGVRWWCGLHSPDRKQRAQADEVSVDPGRFSALVSALREAQMVLIELGNTRDAGWPPNTPVERYKVLMTHMADRARQAGLDALKRLNETTK